MGAYISFNQEEQGLLNGADYDALALYFFLKQKANFKTGMFGTFKNQRFRYLDLCAALYRPASVGRSCRDFDEAGVKALLADLEKLGLVSGRQFDGDRLTMELPLSKKWGRNVTASPMPLPAVRAGTAPATPAFWDGDQFNDVPEEVFFEMLESCARPVSGLVASSSVDVSSVMITTDSSESTDPIDENPDDWEQGYEDAMRDEIGDGGTEPIEAGDEDIALADESEPDTEAGTAEPIILADESESDEDEDIDALDLDEWMDMLASRMSGSPLESECAEHHAPRGHQ